MIRFACPACEKVYKVPDQMGGRPAACTQCQSRFLIPELPVAAAAVVVPPPPSYTSVIPVVLEPCPKCRGVLTVSKDDLGHPVTCPFCQTVYPCVACKPRVPESIPSASEEAFGSAPSTILDGFGAQMPNLDFSEVLDAEVVESVPPTPPPPSPPPPPSKLVIPRELEPCPRCAAVNSVASEHIGEAIECPFCKTAYLGVARRPAPPPAPVYIPVPMYGMPHQQQRGGHFSDYWTRPSYGMPLSPPPPPPPVIVFAPPPPVPVSPTVPTSAQTPVPDEVDIAPCPQCRAALTVSPADVGTEVECPFCRAVYPAVPPKPTEGTQLAKVVRRAKAKPTGQKSNRFWWSTGEGGSGDPGPKGRKG